MEETKMSALVATTMVFLATVGALWMLSMSTTPVGAAEEETSGGMQASIATVVDIDINKWPKWTSISKGATDQLADTDNGNPTQFTIKSTTTVPTKIQVKGSDNLEISGGADYIGIDNVEIGNDGTGSDQALSTTYTDVSWLTSIAVPGASDNTQNVYFYLNTRANQRAGTYTGTLYVKLVEI